MPERSLKPRIHLMTSLILFCFGMHCILRGIALPVIQHDFNLTYTQTSAIVGISSAGYLLMSLFSVKLSSKIGRKNLLTICAAIIFVTALCIALSKIYGALVFIILVAGTAYGGIECMATALIQKVNPLQPHRAVNRVFGFYNLGGLVAAIGGGWILNQGLGWRFAYLLIAAIAAMSFFYSLTIQDIQKKEEVQTTIRINSNGLFKDRIFVIMCLLTAVLSGVGTAVINWMNTFLLESSHDMTIWRSSCITAFYFVFILAGRLASEPLLSRLEGVTLAIICCFLTSAVVMLISFASSPWWIIVGIALFGFFASCLYPLFISITNRVTAENNSYAVSFAAISIFNFLMNYLTGIFADVFGMAKMFGLCSMLYFEIGFVMLVYRRKILGQERSQSF